MFNPLCLFNAKILEAFVKAGKTHFVRQTYSRALALNDQHLKGCFLITHYADEGEAKQHYEAVQSDANRFLYDWSNERHRRRLHLAATQPPGYKIYASVVMPGWEKEAAQVLKEKVHAYITRKMKWHPSRLDAIDFDLYPHFGEVFVKMRFRKQEIKVSLAEVEKFS